MVHTSRTWDVLEKERREQIIQEIIAYFATEQDQEIGVVAAGDMLDFFLETLVSDVYNKALVDVKQLFDQHHGQFEMDLDAMRRS